MQLESPPQGYVVGTGLNADGVYTAYSGDAVRTGASNVTGAFAFLAAPDGATSFTVEDVNDSGEMVGGISGNASSAFRLKAGKYTPLDPLTPGTEVVASSINDDGVAVGAGQLEAGNHFVAVRFDGATPTALGSLGGTDSYANGVNDRGHAVGEASLAGGARHAFLSADDELIDLGVIDGPNSTAYDVNEHDLVVGGADKGAGRTAVAWTSKDGLVDLSTRLGAATGWELTAALGVNESGQIVGSAVRDGRPVGFVLTPR